MTDRIALTRRSIIGASTLSALTAACEALGLKATIVTTTNVNGKEKTTVREAKNWDEFETAMGEVATDFSGFAKEVGQTTAELAKKLVDVPPQGEVKIGQLAEGLKPFEGNVRYDYLKVAKANPNAAYDFKYAQLGMPEFDDFFRASAEMYGAAYQLQETGRHVHLAQLNLRDAEVPADIEDGGAKIRKGEVEAALSDLKAGATPEIKSTVDNLSSLWITTAQLGAQLAQKAAATAQAGAALVATAPSQILNPQLVLHLDLIVEGLEQSVSMVKDTGAILVDIVS
jgi:hypothetical protein